MQFIFENPKIWMTSIELSHHSPVKAFNFGVSSSGTALDWEESQGYFLNPINLDIFEKPHNLTTLDFCFDVNRRCQCAKTQLFLVFGKKRQRHQFFQPIYYFIIFTNTESRPLSQQSLTITEKTSLHLRLENKIDWWIVSRSEIDDAFGWLGDREEFSYGKEKGIVQ